MESDMLKSTPARAAELLENLTTIRNRVDAVRHHGPPVRLLAVSKLKPASDVAALHAAEGNSRQVHFGENYLQELRDKAAVLPRSICWHFIGGLQTNKCKELARVANIWSVESVDTRKKADALEKARAAFLQEEPDADLLGIHVQVNTSGEENKSGVSPQETSDLVRHVLTQCPHLKLRGLMTIGAIARSMAGGENEDFTCLVEVRDRVLKQLEKDNVQLPQGIELSMGMSADFEAAISLGTAEVRVGSQIFGERPPKN